MGLTLSGSSPSLQSYQGGALTSGTAVASTSGTAITFSSIPSWAKRITVMFAGVSTNGSSQVQLQLQAGSTVTTGYATASWEWYASSTLNTTSFNLDRAGSAVSASTTRSGNFVLTNLTGNTWTGMGQMARTDSGPITVCQGSITLGSALTGLVISAVNGTDTFDAGSINILYE